MYTTHGKNLRVTQISDPQYIYWHLDLMLVAAWQSSAICLSNQVTSLDGELESVNGQGVGAKYKCTYKFTVAEGKGAPSFKINSASFVQFNFHWVEFETSALNSIVPNSSETTTFNLGNVVGKWPYPIKTYTQTSLEYG